MKRDLQVVARLMASTDFGSDFFFMSIASSSSSSAVCVSRGRNLSQVNNAKQVLLRKH